MSSVEMEHESFPAAGDGEVDGMTLPVAMSGSIISLFSWVAEWMCEEVKSSLPLSISHSVTWAYALPT